MLAIKLSASVAFLQFILSWWSYSMLQISAEKLSFTLRAKYLDSLMRQETEYFERTRIFPIMHMLTIRIERYEQDPSLAVKLFDAFQLAKQHSFNCLYNGDALHVMLPWLVSEIETTIEIMSANFWPYGIEPNRHVLEAFVRHLDNQGLIDGSLSIEALLAPDCLSN